MPLGNLTSQFFANVYLNELDQFVKHNLRAKYYIRYVDDFVILHELEWILADYKNSIENFLKSRLLLELHPQKSRIIRLSKGVQFLGFRIFYHHRLLKKSNIRKFERKFSGLLSEYQSGSVDYDSVYDFLEGWLAYAENANTYRLRQRVARLIAASFGGEIRLKK